LASIILFEIEYIYKSFLDNINELTKGLILISVTFRRPVTGSSTVMSSSGAEAPADLAREALEEVEITGLLRRAADQIVEPVRVVRPRGCATGRL
jgi:hypothetical protein